MQYRAVQITGVLLLSGWLAGCANVKVQKVDVQSRINGTDEHVNGFRYYLTRPYLVIASRVSVSRDYNPVWIAEAKLKTDTSDSSFRGEKFYLVSAVPDEHNQYIVYDPLGRPTKLKKSDVTILGVSSTGINTSSQVTSAIVINAIAKVVTDKITEIVPLTPNGPESQGVLGSLLKAMKEAPTAGKIQEQFTGSFAAKPNVSEAVKIGMDASVTIGNDYLKTKKSKATLDVAALTASVNKLLPSVTPAQPTGGAALATVQTDTGNTPDSGKTSTPTPVQQADPGPFQVVFLPDFEEQYAIRNVNVVAKTKYRYTFRNGTDLETVSGSYNATDVPVKLVETVGALVTAAGEVAKTRLGAVPAAAKSTLEVGSIPDAPFYIREEWSIEPGIYRVQKSWERAANTPLQGLPADRLSGLFGDIGLSLVRSTSVIDGATHKSETTKQTAPAAQTPGK